MMGVCERGSEDGIAAAWVLLEEMWRSAGSGPSCKLDGRSGGRAIGVAACVSIRVCAAGFECRRGSAPWCLAVLGRRERRTAGLRLERGGVRKLAESERRRGLAGRGGRGGVADE